MFGRVITTNLVNNKIVILSFLNHLKMSNKMYIIIDSHYNIFLMCNILNEYLKSKG